MSGVGIMGVPETRPLPPTPRIGAPAIRSGTLLRLRDLLRVHTQHIVDRERLGLQVLPIVTAETGATGAAFPE